MDEKTIRAMLVDRSWLFALPDASTSRTYQVNSFINSMLINALNDEFKVPTCHAALFDADGSVNPGFFLWDPKPDVFDKIISTGPLIYLTPKDFFVKGKPLLHPDLSTLEVTHTDHRKGTALKFREKDAALALTFDTTQRDKNPYFRDGHWRNCFFVIPRPFPSVDTLMEKFETLANIRGLDMNEEWPKLAREAKAGKFTPSTQRSRALLIEVCITVCPDSAYFGLQYLDSEGKHV